MRGDRRLILSLIAVSAALAGNRLGFVIQIRGAYQEHVSGLARPGWQSHRRGHHELAGLSRNLSADKARRIYVANTGDCAPLAAPSQHGLQVDADPRAPGTIYAFFGNEPSFKDGHADQYE